MIHSGRVFAVSCAMALLSVVAACAGSSGDGDTPGREEERGMTDSTIVAAQEALTDSVMSLSGVVGIAIGRCGDTPCIKVYLSREDAGLRSQIPETFQGFPVDVEVTGEVRARDP